MDKEISIDAVIVVLSDLAHDEFWNKFIDFIEENNWLFGGGINPKKNLERTFHIDGCTMVQPSSTADEFKDKFIKLVEENNWLVKSFDIREIVDGYYINPDGSQGKHVNDPI
ncbi:hypothetical protein AN639_10460 [Candidatus Epulonipiscium fishelsonii]|uniref:Uncharacterized protein n=1 Tax=Candidatus Epulonipiscium fishelsonii TaxID=77094 RepID=A0ACC8XA61_9FIRM|nr:hypothetical protein AN396_09080 [Epulopiscium sp. SCG-B11WGA-EpuloA1]ONI43516.1 hypothetical protein AN639_10460 [Epulopiscium sp. SCG-B05WGA-EpuloA1]